MSRFLIIKGCKLVCSGYACPEQYDVFFEDAQIGYLRLRHGRFTAEYPDHNGELVYQVYPAGDGMFEDTERMPHLKEAVKRLIEAHNKKVISDLDYYK